MQKIFLSVLGLFFMAILASAEGTIESLTDYKYWDDGTARGCDIYDAKGRLRARSYNRPEGSVEKIEKFDLNGNKIEVVLYDEKGRLRSGIDGWAAMRWWYDDSSLMAEMTYDQEGKPISRRIYSKGGNLIDVAFSKDAEINPYEEANMRLILLSRQRRQAD